MRSGRSSGGLPAMKKGHHLCTHLGRLVRLPWGKTGLHRGPIHIRLQRVTHVAKDGDSPDLAFVCILVLSRSIEPFRSTLIDVTRPNMTHFTGTHSSSKLHPHHCSDDGREECGSFLHVLNGYSLDFFCLPRTLLSFFQGWKSFNRNKPFRWQ